MKPNRIRALCTAAMLLVLVLPAGAALRQPVTAETKPVQTADFLAPVPTGENWVYLQRNLPGFVSFRKQDPIRSTFPGGEHQSFTVEIRAETQSGQDLLTLDGLEAALKAWLYRDNEGSYGPLRVESFPWQETDCLVFMSSRQLPEEIDGRQVIFLSASEGFFCRHPLNARIAIIGYFQERHLAGTPSLLNDALREEAERILQGVRFPPFFK